MRFFLIDRVTELVPGERVRGVKNITLTDEILHEHLPDQPITRLTSRATLFDLLVKTRPGGVAAGGAGVSRGSV